MTYTVHTSIATKCVLGGETVRQAAAGAGPVRICAEDTLRTADWKRAVVLQAPGSELGVARWRCRVGL